MVSRVGAIFAEVVKEPDGSVRVPSPGSGSKFSVPLENEDWPQVAKLAQEGGAVPTTARDLVAGNQHRACARPRDRNRDCWSEGNVGIDRAHLGAGGSSSLFDNGTEPSSIPVRPGPKWPTTFFEGVDRFPPRSGRLR